MNDRRILRQTTSEKHPNTRQATEETLRWSKVQADAHRPNSKKQFKQQRQQRQRQRRIKTT